MEAFMCYIYLDLQFIEDNVLQSHKNAAKNKTFFYLL